MTSPDVSRYIDLKVYDRQPIDIQNEAVEYARTALPDWLPVVASIEDALLQAASWMTGHLAGAINRLPSSVFEGLLQLLRINRVTGVAASGSVTVTTTNSFGHTLPVGTRLGYYDNADPDNPILYTFDTVEELTIPLGQTSGSTQVTAALIGQYPALPAGTPLQVLTPTSFVQSATLATNLNPGTDGETDDEYFGRAVSILNSYSSALVLPAQYEQYLLSNYTSVFRCKAFTRVNPVNNNFTDALENGYLTVYACGPDGASIAPAAVTAIEQDLTNRSVAGLSIALRHPTIVPVTLATTVAYKVGSIPSVVKAAVEQALNEYLHPDWWDWNQYIYYNEVIARIDAVEGVERVVSLSIPVAAGTTDIGNSNLRFNKRGALPRVTASVVVQ